MKSATSFSLSISTFENANAGLADAMYWLVLISTENIKMKINEIIHLNKGIPSSLRILCPY